MKWFIFPFLFFSRSRYCLKVFVLNESDLFNVFVRKQETFFLSFFYEHKKSSEKWKLMKGNLI